MSDAMVVIGVRVPEALVEALKRRCPYQNPTNTVLARWALSEAAGVDPEEYAAHRPPGQRRAAAA